MEKSESDRARVLKYLKEHGSITAMQAVQIFNTTRVGARVYELRGMGYDISTIMTYGTDPVTKEQYKYGTYIFHGRKGDGIQTDNGAAAE